VDCDCLSEDVLRAINQKGDRVKRRHDAILLALQIAFEYAWGPEHVSGMLDTYEDSGETPPCSYDELMELTLIAAKAKRDGCTFNEAEKLMMSRRR
jgi:hypothetical protein